MLYLLNALSIKPNTIDLLLKNYRLIFYFFKIIYNQ